MSRDGVFISRCGTGEGPVLKRLLSSLDGTGVVSRVLPQSPALRAGLLPGDRLVAINGQEIAAPANVKALLLDPDQERSLSLKVERAGEPRTFELRSELFENVAVADLRRELPLRSGPYRFDPNAYIVGIGVLYAPDPREAMVSEVSWPSPAFDAGLHAGDSILAVNGKPISAISREDMGKLLVPQGPAPSKLEISRLGKKKTLTVKPATYRDAEQAIGRKPTKSDFVPQGCPAS